MNQNSSSPSSSSKISYFINLFLFFVIGFYAHLAFSQFITPPQNNINTSSFIRTENNNQNYINKPNDNLNFGLFNDVWAELQNRYVDPQVFIEKEPFEYGVIKGLISGLEDPFSAFMTPEENKEFTESLHGNFEGIGAELVMKNSAITIVSPLKGSPAESAGLMPEDIIIKVNNEDILDKSLPEVVSKIRGEKGTEVLLTIYRTSLHKTLDIPITRNVITISSVESEMLVDNIAYIEINQFGDDTVLAFSKQFADLMEKKPKGIILDLQFNSGGYLDGAIEIASAFFTKDTDIVEVRSKNNSQMYKSKYKVFADINTPLVVLINKGSASASEIVAGAIQDNKRGVIVGEQSFGKGTVQEVVPLSQGASLRLTIAKWFTPLGHSIHKEGITPNIGVEKTLADIENKKTPERDKAIEIINDVNWKNFMEQKVEKKLTSAEIIKKADEEAKKDPENLNKIDKVKISE